jgi:hypothetical protein
MKEYIKNNLTPILIGFSIGISSMVVLNTIEDIIIKISLIKSK